MKFKKLTIRNYRGVAESSVEFADRGITLVQGPNEAGKTSLATSINVLFNVKSGSDQREAREIRPVHRDANPEVELEAQSGPYHFTYAKTYRKKTGSTILTIHRPTPANYTADAAHDKVNGILKETLDKDLWNALIIRQGDMIDIPKLSGKAALMSALDAAAGGSAADESSENLFELVCQEYEKYFTRDGSENSLLTKSAAELARAQARVRETEERLRDLEGKIERSATLKKRLAEIRTLSAEKSRAHEEYRLLAEEVAAAEQAVSRERLALHAAEARAQAAAREAEDRNRLVEEAEGAGREAASAASGLDGEAGLVQDAEARFAGAQEAARQLEAEREALENRLRLARADCDYFTNCLQRDMMRDQKRRIDSARAGREDAERRIGVNAVTDNLLEQIREADLDAARLRAQLEAEAPRVTLRGLASGEILVDGESAGIKENEVSVRTAAAGLRITVPDLVEIDVLPGGKSKGMAERLAEAEERLAGLFRQAGAADLEQAYAALEKRRQAEIELRQHQEAERAALRDLTLEEFAARLQGLEQEMAAYLAGRDSAMPLPENADAAKALVAAAETECRRADRALHAAKDEVEAARAAREAAASRRNALLVEKDLTEKRLRQVQAKLAGVRESVGDEVLAARRQEADQALGEARERLRLAEEALAAKNAGKVRAMLATLSGSLQSLQRQENEVERELAGLRAELKVRGEEGLFEELQTAGAEVERHALRDGKLRADAAAARSLYEAMRQARERARRAYMAPLKEKIEELGRWVFDSSFSIEMDEEDLSIASRTMNGATVPYKSLSGGAREQLSLIFRAACCIIVSAREGMPLMLDDALGYTDPERLQLMGAVLAKAAEQCQIIIFTCVPERYATIGDAKVVQL